MKQVSLGDYLLWKGELAKIIGESNQRSVIIELLENAKCPHCDGYLGKKQIDVIVASPLFQENAEGLKTIIDNKKS